MKFNKMRQKRATHEFHSLMQKDVVPLPSHIGLRGILKDQTYKQRPENGKRKGKIKWDKNKQNGSTLALSIYKISRVSLTSSPSKKLSRRGACCSFLRIVQVWILSNGQNIRSLRLIVC